MTGDKTSSSTQQWPEWPFLPSHKANTHIIYFSLACTTTNKKYPPPPRWNLDGFGRTARFDFNSTERGGLGRQKCTALFTLPKCLLWLFHIVVHMGYSVFFTSIHSLRMQERRVYSDVARCCLQFSLLTQIHLSGEVHIFRFIYPGTRPTDSVVYTRTHVALRTCMCKCIYGLPLNFTHNCEAIWD